ncbi:MAG: hypothetical protein R3E82_09755 [Pseudomonadales bacterium]|nr:hypothetical protein [Pseudomonadales bacterium]
MRRAFSGTRHFGVMVAVATVFTGTLQAQGTPQAGQDPVAEVLACGSQADDLTRLACYDRLHDAYLKQTSLKPSSPDRPVPDPAAGDPDRNRQEADFGVEHHQSNKSTSEITSAVVRIERNALGGLVLTLENDQVWQQSDRSRIQVEVGDRVTISRGALSAFHLRVNDGQKRARFNRAR